MSKTRKPVRPKAVLPRGLRDVSGDEQRAKRNDNAWTNPLHQQTNDR